MKCLRLIKKSEGEKETIIRISDTDATAVMDIGGWEYCCKADWRTAGKLPKAKTDQILKNILKQEEV